MSRHTMKGSSPGNTHMALHKASRNEGWMRFARGLVDMKKLVGCCLVLWFALAPFSEAARGDDPQRIKVSVEGYSPYGGRTDLINLVCYRLMREDPQLEVVPHTQMTIMGGPGYEAGRYMAQAGKVGPDVITWLEFHNIRSYVRQGFFHPLNEFIGHDEDGDGYISNDEAIWEEWKRLPEYYRRVATVDGKVYGVPNINMGMAALLYRKDLLRKAGFRSEEPPRDWNEFYRMLQALTLPHKEIPGARIQRGQRGIAIAPSGWQFPAWIWAAGGDVVMQGKTNPRTGKTHWYVQEDLTFIDPENGDDLGRQPSRWKATFAEPAGIKAIDFYRRMRFAPWIRHPETAKPIDLADEQVEQGWAILPDGSRLEFDRRDVIEGVARVCWGAETATTSELLRRGEVAIIFMVCEPLFLHGMDIPPESIGFWAVPPAERGGRPAMLAQYHYKAMNAELAGEANKAKRQKAWNILSTLGGRRGAVWQTQQMAKAGLAQFVDPAMLQRAGMTEYLQALPEHWRRNLTESLKYARTEPFEGFWPPIKTKILNNDVLSLTLTQRDFDHRGALIKAQEAANAGLMFSRSDEQMSGYRPWGWLGVALWGGIIVLLSAKMWRALRFKVRQGDVVARSGRLRVTWAPILLLGPAVGLILMWQYYPLVRGGAMAFQDYKISGDSQWVGVDNFVNVFLDASFWLYLRQTLKFVCLSVLLGFFMPIILAVLLAEVPRGKILFRTIFFLPQVCSGLVIMLLWRQFYSPTAAGLLNKVLWFADPIDWLGDPTWAMSAVILPGVWAGAGIGSLLYLAALKSIPDDLYEAASVDGAGMWRRIRSVTIPSLLPLIIINFVGVSIATFHSMGNIFVMTAGGPGNETMVISLAIWYEAFAFLRFGTATAMAWILGSLLIGFTVVQLNILKRVEFRRAEAT